MEDEIIETTTEYQDTVDRIIIDIDRNEEEVEILFPETGGHFGVKLSPDEAIKLAERLIDNARKFDGIYTK